MNDSWINPSIPDLRDDLPPTLDAVYNEFEGRLRKYGRKVVIAGGAVRDYLLGRTPKDYDVFVLDPIPGAPDYDVIKGSMHADMDDLEHPDDPRWAYGLSDGFVGSYEWRWAIVQIMVVPYTTVEDLLDSFDWNISQFGYMNGKIYTHGTVAKDIQPGAYLRLASYPRWPASTLRRGLDFAKRFEMKLTANDLHLLVSTILQKQATGEPLK